MIISQQFQIPKKSVAVNARLLPIFEFLHLRGSVLNEKALDSLINQLHTPVEMPPYVSCKNLAEVERIRHYLQESCKFLTFQTNLSDSVRSDIFGRFRRFLQDSWTYLARQCLRLKVERTSARKYLECTENRKKTKFDFIFI